MRFADFDVVSGALDAAGVRYLVAGGLAVGAHGYLRYTKDADLVIELVPENILAAFTALGRMGYRPVAPLTAAEFADPDTRRGWIRDKGMKVVQLCSDKHREMPIDVFAEYSFDFSSEYERALRKTRPDGGIVRFVGLQTLMGMKRAAGRPQDLADLDNLRLLSDGDSGGVSEPGWSSVTWDGSRRNQLRNWAALSLEEMILSLEDMEALYRRLQEENALPDQR